MSVNLNFSTISREQTQLKWGQLPGSSLSFTLVEAAKHYQRPIVFIASSILQAQQLLNECEFFAKDTGLPILFFPDRETLPYDSFSPHQDLISERLACLYKLPHVSKGIIITAGNTVAHKLIPQSFLSQQCFVIKKNDQIEIDNFRQQLTHAGYKHVSQVMEHGEYVIRGSIIDVFPMGSKEPIRIDLFDTEVDSLRYFNPETQLSGATMDELNLLPAHEFALNEIAITQFRQKWRAVFSGKPSQCPMYQNISDGIAMAGAEYYLPLFFDETADFFAYLPSESLIFNLPDLESSLQHFWNDISYRYDQYGHDVTRPLIKPTELFLDSQILLEKLNLFSRVKLSHESIPEKTGCHNFSFQPSPNLIVNRKAKEPLCELKSYLADISHPVVFSVETAGRREVLLELLATANIHPHTIQRWSELKDLKEHKHSIIVAPLYKGFFLVNEFEVITENQLFGEQTHQTRKRTPSSKYQQQADNAIRDLLELKVGDAIVHVEHGIGRYKGLQTLNLSGQTQEFLTIEYANESKLYVPVSSLHLISRYGGVDPNHAPLHYLGNEKWSKEKQKAAEKVRDAAAELLAIYAKRESKKGFSSSKQTNYIHFANAFPFEETPDQAKAIKEVIADMESPKAMDRLICGDVGFGKTEVAMRAAFIAVENHKQVVMLAPTTLLAQQHYQTFLDRFADWPVRIEVLSRFKSKKQADEIIAQLAVGTIDIVIGTHKLLQKDVAFKNLGLLVIDEEHRFGVQQKEKIKAIRAEVDILTLTATPIPRTLNLSLSGLRDLSLITTPPAKRLSIKTFVYEKQDMIIREAILRELQRGGQIYFLHNNVETIETMAEEIQRIVPEIRLAIAHGQMREKQLEQVMLDFYHHRINLLLCTTIIESGIDVPTANTIIMNRADKLGLAQLHQLRGRVGRSHHQAYAYLLIPGFKSITSDAKKRLEAIASHEDLGAGFMLANHDLEIRGAGELLGEDQSGQIQSIGFTLYMELLERAVNSLKSGHVANFDEIFQQSTEVEIQIPALIPENYIPDVHNRLIVYKRISHAKNKEALKELQIELIDRFGLLPQPLKNLFGVTELRILSEKLGIKKLESNKKQGKIHFTDKPNIEPAQLIKLIQIKPAKYKLAGQDKLNFFYGNEVAADKLIHAVNEVLAELAG